MHFENNNIDKPYTFVTGKLRRFEKKFVLKSTLGKNWRINKEL